MNINVELRKVQYVFLVLIVSLLAGSIISYEPLIGVVIVLLFFFLIMTLINSNAILYIVLLLASVSVQYLIDFNLAGIDFVGLYKLLILYAFMILTLYYRIKISYDLVQPAITITILFLISLFVVISSKEFSIIFTIKAYLAYLGAFLILIISWSLNTARKIIHLLILLPIFSCIIGVLLDLVGIRDVFMYEYTGVKRFQGANVPAHLAELCYVAVASAVYMYLKTEQNRYLFFLALNMLILAFTYTRIFLLASILLSSIIFLKHIKNILRRKSIYVVSMVAMFSLFSVVLALSIKKIIERTFNYNGQFDTSGRKYAWEYFMQQAEKHELFGRGLGISQLLNPPVPGFIAPHNEFIRFYLETGILGTILIFISLIVVFLKIYRYFSLDEQDKLLNKFYFIGFILTFLLLSYYDNMLSNIQSLYPVMFFLSSIYTLQKNN